MSKHLTETLNSIAKLLEEQNSKLDKITALIAGNQLLTECIDPHGNVRTAEQCADITVEAFSSALCLMPELEQRNKEYQYQKQEFFIDDGDEDEGSDISSKF